MHAIPSLLPDGVHLHLFILPGVLRVFVPVQFPPVCQMGSVCMQFPHLGCSCLPVVMQCVPAAPKLLLGVVCGWDFFTLAMQNVCVTNFFTFTKGGV